QRLEPPVFIGSLDVLFLAPYPVFLWYKARYGASSQLLTSKLPVSPKKLQGTMAHRIANTISAVSMPLLSNMRNHIRLVNAKAWWKISNGRTPGCQHLYTSHRG